MAEPLQAEAEIGDADGVLELVWLPTTTLLGWLRPRHDLVLENLLLRHQLAVLTRPTRTRPRVRLRVGDKWLWVLARRFCAGWRAHRSIVTPEAVVRAGIDRAGACAGAGRLAREAVVRSSAPKCRTSFGACRARTAGGVPSGSAVSC